jgi:hypothetical protein
MAKQDLEVVDPQERFLEFFKKEKYRTRISQLAITGKSSVTIDFDELYNLEADPYELTNLADKPQYQDRVKQMMKLAWQYIKRTGDKTLLNTQYPACRLAPVGPGVLEQ